MLQLNSPVVRRQQIHYTTSAATRGGDRATDLPSGQDGAAVLIAAARYILPAATTTTRV